MKTRWLCFLIIALGILAGVLVVWLRLLDGDLDNQLTFKSLPLSHVLEPITVASLVIGVVGTLLVTVRLGLALRHSRRRAKSQLGTASKQPLSPSDLDSAVTSILAPRTRARDLDGGATLSPTITRSQLLRLYWRHLGLLQVWSATGILILEGILIWQWDASPELSSVISALTPVGVSILGVLLFVALMRLLIGNRIKRSIEVLKWPVAVPDRRGPALQRVAATPMVTTPTLPLAPSASSLNTPLSIHSKLGNYFPDTDGTAAEHPPTVEIEATTPPAATGSQLTPQDQQASLPDIRAPDIVGPRLAEIFSAIEYLRRQQDAMKDAIQALIDAAHITAETHLEISQQLQMAGTWAPRLQELAENITAHVAAIEKEWQQETRKLRDEMRERDEAQQRNIVELCTSLNRLEARIIPTLRRASSAHRAMAIVLQRLNRIEKQDFHQNPTLEERPELSAPEPGLPQPPAKDIREDSSIASQLRQLMIDLDDATVEPAPKITLDPGG